MSRTDKCKSCKYYDKKQSTENWDVCLNISQGTLDYKAGIVDVCSEYKKAEE